MAQQLSQRDSNLFRTVIRHYEEKQYKRGLKAADQILKKNPKHGDTMAMKALIMNSQGKTEDAFALAKEALTVAMKSHICWHVYGILYKANKNFDEAIKAYKFALKLEPDSVQIQRDLASLQIQMRDYQGYIQSRLAMLKARPQLRQSWSALAVAYHLAGNLQEAENILTTYEDTLKTAPLKTDLEHAEAVLYKNTVIAEQGDYQRALDHLEVDGKNALDRLAFMELRAKYMTKLGRKDEAAAAYKALLDRNSERSEYYQALVQVLGIESDARAIKGIYDEYAEKSPRSDAAKRLPLDFLHGDDFREAAKKYVTLMLNKGVPSTFANLKHLYCDDFKKQAIPTIVEDYIADQRDNPADNHINGDSSKGVAAAFYFMAQHYNYHRSRDLNKASEFVEMAIKLGPNNVDYYMTRARILKHHGDTQKAAEAMDAARRLDLRDRYINSKAAKYQLRNNENEKALETMGLFTRAETVGGPLADLLDMQCVWFLTEDGEAYHRRGNIGLALKRFHAIFNIFDIWQEDQFDFHGFSIRKGIIRAYVDLIHWEDHLRDHPFFSRAALDAVRIYLAMYDHPSGVNGINGDSESAENLAERKKAAKKARKAADKAEKEAAERLVKQDPNKMKGKEGELPKKKDDDPLGLKLAATEDPLGDAMKFLGPLLQFSPKNIDAQIAGFEVYIRRKKYLLALGCLNAGLSLNPAHPRLHEHGIRLRHELNSSLDSLQPQVQEVINSAFTTVSNTADLKKVNAEYRQQHGESSPLHVLAAARASAHLGEDRNSLERALVGLLNLSMDKIGYVDAENILETLRQWRSKEASAFKKMAHEKWPEVTAFV